jgi:CTP-dependent riboflavin kinase
MKIHADVYRATTGLDAYPGTLNVELDQPWRTPTESEPIVAGVSLFLIPCRINCTPAFVMRTENNERGTGDHPLTVVEIISDKPLRELFDLHDGDQISLELP